MKSIRHCSFRTARIDGQNGFYKKLLQYESLRARSTNQIVWICELVESTHFRETVFFPALSALWDSLEKKNKAMLLENVLKTEILNVKYFLQRLLMLIASILKGLSTKMQFFWNYQQSATRLKQIEDGKFKKLLQIESLDVKVLIHKSWILLVIRSFAETLKP